MATYLTRAELEERLTIAGLTALASITGTLSAADETRITEILADTSGRIDAVVGGLGLGENDSGLEDIALAFAKCELWRRTWVPVGLADREDLASEAKAAEERLEKYREGKRAGGGGTPGVSVAGRFSWRNVGDDPSETNPRRTLRSGAFSRLP